MNLPLELYAIFVAFIMILSVFASKLSERFGIPVLVGFLVIGMLAGSDGILGISFDDPNLAQTIGTIALVFILFTGGLDTLWKSIKPVLKEGFILATVGVFITAIITAGFAYYILSVPLYDSLLIGAIVSSTDAAAVFAIFRARGVNVHPKLRSLLELESGSNDPMAIFLTVAVLQFITMPEAAPLSKWLIDFFLQFTIGGALGYLLGILMPSIFNRLHLAHYGLYVVFSIAWVWLIFGASTYLGGNGYLAVYIAGICINAREFVHKKNLIGFHDGLAWLMQIFVFVTLGLLVFPSELPHTALPALAIALWLMIIARPISVFAALIFNKVDLKEKIFISWVGLRGAVPIILATYPFIYQIGNAALIFNVVFFIVLFSILIQGTSLAPFAKYLKVTAPIVTKKTPPPSSPLIPQSLKQHYLDESSYIVGKSLAELALPSEFLVLLIKRDNEYTKPTGSTIFEKDDMLLIQCDDPKILEETLACFTHGIKA